MAKCGHCGTDIQNAEITYRPSNTGSRRTQSIRLCFRCVERHDKTESAKKVRNIGILVAVIIALILTAAYLIVKR